MLAIFFYFTYNIAKGGRKNMKIAKVGYGRDGRGVGKTNGGYAYLVNNNVRTGDVIQPIATSSRGRKFVTTGKVNHSYSENSVLGREAKQQGEQALKNSEYNKIGQEKLTQIKTGKEMGIENVPISPTTSKQYDMEYSKNKIGEYNKLARGGQVAQFKQEYPQAQFTEKAQTFEEKYIKPYMEAQRK